MKIFIAIAIFAIPTFSLARGIVSAIEAASIVRQPGVEQCISVVENNLRGAAQFSSITLDSVQIGENSKTRIFKLEGNNIYGDVVAGLWEISVEVHSEKEGNIYSCKIIKNLE